MSSTFDDLIRRERSKHDFLTKQAESVLRPLREHERFIENMMTPSIRDALTLREQALGNTLGMLREDYAAKFLEEASTMTRLLEVQRRPFEDIAALHSTRLADQMKDLIGPSFADQLKTAAAASTFLPDFRNALAASATSSLRDLAVADFSRFALSSTAHVARFMQDVTKPSGVAEMLAGFLAEAERLASPAVSFAPRGIAVDSDLVAAADLTTHIREAISHAVEAPRPERLREFLAQCLVLIRRVPKPIARALVALVSTIFLMIAEGEVQEISTDLLAPARRALMTKIRKLTRQAARQSERHQPSALRVVTAKDTLNVRLHPRKSDSRVLGTLELGTVVVATREVKDWTLVEYREEDSVITGWVYTRYLKKVVLPVSTTEQE